jgi:DNA-binding GntR family transcriptional regulator
VRRAILRGELVASQRLIEPDLAEMLGVHRSSVRAALIDLAAEGLVEQMPNKGARVRLVPVAEAIAVNECRRVLDGLCWATADDRRALGRKAGNRVSRACKVISVSRWYWRFTTAPGGAARNHAR